MTPTEIQQMALAAGFAAVVHGGEVIVSGLRDEGPLAVVSTIPGSANGIRVCMPAMLEAGLRERVVQAFSPAPQEQSREVSIVLSGPTAPAPGRARFAPAELLNAASSPRPRAAKSAWTAPLASTQPAKRGVGSFPRRLTKPGSKG
jgi:hypothetical protein